MELETYLESLASSAPTPGGGSAATVVIALAAALVAMVARVTRANPKHAAKASLADELVAAADAARAGALAARTDDEAAYGNVVAAMALPRATESEQARRTEEVQAALAAAAAAPLRGAALAAAVAALGARSLELENPGLVSDLGCAADFAAASLSACAYNVRVNHRFMRDRAATARNERELARYENETEPLIERVRSATRHVLAQ